MVTPSGLIIQECRTNTINASKCEAHTHQSQGNFHKKGRVAELVS
ncbi:hypothetical protein PT7_0340 [Pusillimonas sp. T7-7]|nr:hypothetical protein PT7_0340 [Pusillimonas sp. T7-7]